MRPRVALRNLIAAALFAAAGPLTAAEEQKGAPIGAAADELPIFDAHMHYKQDAWGPFPPGTVIELMDRSGVAMALVSSTPDEGTIRLLEFAPGRIVPELRPYHGDAGSANWTRAPGMRAYLEQRLKDHPHRGIGEFHVHGVDLADKELLADVARMAVERGIPVHIHSGAEPVRFFYGLQPKLTVIWAHAGMTEPAETVGEMMDRYDTLHADTSYRENDISSGSALDPAWEAVLLRHADRFMVGTDTWINGQWEQYEGLVALNRSWLRLLPREVAERIAYGNAERLFGRKVTRELIGTK